MPPKKSHKKAGGDGPDHCAKLLEVGTKICNEPDVKKYGDKMVAKCLKGYQESAAAGDQTKCKMLTPTRK